MCANCEPLATPSAGARIDLSLHLALHAAGALPQHTYRRHGARPPGRNRRGGVAVQRPSRGIYAPTTRSHAGVACRRSLKRPGNPTSFAVVTEAASSVASSGPESQVSWPAAESLSREFPPAPQVQAVWQSALVSLPLRVIRTVAHSAAGALAELSYQAGPASCPDDSRESASPKHRQVQCRR